MKGEDLARPHGTSAPLGHVFVSYAHDPEGKLLAEAICSLLCGSGVEVVSDHTLSVLSPSSIPGWMDDRIARGITLLVVTRAFAQAFDEERPGARPHRGVRYELRAIRQRIHDHTGPAGVPVVPVLAPGFTAEELPPTLRGLAVERFDPETGLGGKEIIQRVLALQRSPRGGSVMFAARPFRQLFQEFEATDPMSGRTVDLINELLQLPPGTEILRAFESIETVIKSRGDHRLMRALSHQCLRFLTSSTDLLPWDWEMEPTIRIRGIGWCSRREHMLEDALEETQRGIRMAERMPNQRRTVAIGKKCLGKIYRLLAEDTTGEDRMYHLKASATYLQAAEKLFEAIDGDDSPFSEVGACLELQARTQFARYRLLNDNAALVQAGLLATRAEALLSPDQARDYYDLVVLQAEIAAANRRANGRRLLGEVIEALIDKPGAAHAENLARACTARAHIALAVRGAKNGAMADLRRARDIYLSQGLAYEAATIAWTMVQVDPREVRQLKITQADVRELERVTTDARLRFAAIEDVKRELDSRVGKHSGQRIDWVHRVRRVRWRDLPQAGP